MHSYLELGNLLHNNLNLWKPTNPKKST
jgi:hypothetical protein